MELIGRLRDFLESEARSCSMEKCWFMAHELTVHGYD